MGTGDPSLCSVLAWGWASSQRLAPLTLARKGPAVRAVRVAPSSLPVWMGWVNDFSSPSVSGNSYLKNGLALSPAVARICHSSQAVFHVSCTYGDSGEWCILHHSLSADRGESQRFQT